MPEINRQLQYVFGQNTTSRTEKDYQELRKTAQNVKKTVLIVFAFGCVAAILAASALHVHMVPLAAFAVLEVGVSIGLGVRYFFLIKEIKSFVIEHPNKATLPVAAPKKASMMPTQDSEETHHLRMRMIEEAKHNVILSGNFCGGHIYDELLLALEKKMQANPNFKAIILAHPKFIKDQKNPLDYKNQTITNRLVEKFPSQFSFIPTSQYLHINPGKKMSINHVKSLVIDYGKYFMMGGTGVKHDFSLKGLDYEDGDTVSGLPRNTKTRIIQVINGLELKLKNLETTVLKSSDSEAICTIMGPLLSLKLGLKKFQADNANIWPLIRHMRSLAISLERFPAYSEERKNFQRTKFLLVKMLKDVQTASDASLFNLPSLLPRSFRDMDWVAKSEGAGEELYQQMLALSHRYECLLANEDRPYNLDSLRLYPAFSSDESMQVLEGDTVTTQLLKTHTPPLEEIDTYVYNIDRDPRISTNVPLKLMTQGPENSKSPLTEELIHHFNTSKSEIVINHMYFTPTPPVLEALIKAAKRGVKITIISNAVHANSPTANSVFGPMNLSKYAKLLSPLTKKERLNVKFYRFNEDNKANHKKAVVIDRRFVIMGSSNLGYKSLETTCDHEINASCDSRDLAKETLEVFDEDIKHSTLLENRTSLSIFERYRAFRYGLMQPLAN